MGIELPFNEKFMAGISYVGTTNKGTPESKCATIEFKGGYQIIANNALNLYGMLAVEKMSGDLGLDYSPLIAGIKGAYNINERMYLDGEFYLLTIANKRLKNDFGDLDMDYTSYLVRYNYRLTEAFALSLGYNSTTLSGSDKDMTLSGFTIGGTYRF